MAGNKIADLQIHISDNTVATTRRLDRLTDALVKLDVVASATKFEDVMSKIMQATRRASGNFNEVTNAIHEMLPSIGKLGLEALNNKGVLEALGIATEETSDKTLAMGDKMGMAGNSARKSSFSIRGFLNTLKQTNTETKKSTSSIGKLVSQFGRLMKIRLMRLAINQILQGISEGFQNVYYWSQMTGGSFDDLVDSVYSSLGQMKNQVGSVASELFTAIAPALQAIISLVIRVANELARLIAFVNGASTYKKAINQGLKYGNALDGVGSSAGSARKEVEELQRTILGFDELNVLNAPNEKSSGGSGGGGSASAGGTNYEDMFEEVPIGQMNLLEKGIAGILGIFKDIIALGNPFEKIIGGLDDIFDSLFTGSSLKTLGKEVSQAFDDWIKNLSPWSKSIWDFWIDFIYAFDIGWINFRSSLKQMWALLKGILLDIEIWLVDAGKFIYDKLRFVLIVLGVPPNALLNLEKIRPLLDDVSVSLQAEKDALVDNSNAWREEQTALIEGEKQALKTGDTMLSGAYKIVRNGLAVDEVTKATTTAMVVADQARQSADKLHTSVDVLTPSFGLLRDKLGVTNTTADGSNEKLLTLRDRLDGVREKLGGASTNAQVYNTKMEKLKGVTDSATKSTDTAKNSFKGVGDKISVASVNLDNFISKKPLLERMKGTFDNMADSMDTLARKLKKVKDNLDGLSHVNVFNSVKYNGINVTVEEFAEGGFPSTGQLFVANESGAELIGSMNGRTAVASNGEITGIREAVIGGAETEARLLREQNSLLRQLLSKESTIGVSTINTAQNRLNRRAGVALT